MKKYIVTTLLTAFCLSSVSAMATELPSSNDAAKRVSGFVVALVGGWFVWQAF